MSGITLNCKLSGHQHCVIKGVRWAIPAGLDGDVAAAASVMNTQSYAHATTVRGGVSSEYMASPVPYLGTFAELLCLRCLR
jgi:hypothetical protein